MAQASHSQVSRSRERTPGCRGGRESEPARASDHLDIPVETGQQTVQANRSVIHDDHLVARMLALGGEALKTAQRLRRDTGERHDDRCARRAS
jgi:hypothetical protein